MNIKGAIGLAAAAIATLFGPSTGNAEAPLTLADTGYFFVGGKMTEIDGRATMINHMYVEYMVPAKKRKP